MLLKCDWRDKWTRKNLYNFIITSEFSRVIIIFSCFILNYIPPRMWRNANRGLWREFNDLKLCPVSVCGAELKSFFIQSPIRSMKFPQERVERARFKELIFVSWNLNRSFYKDFLSQKNEKYIHIFIQIEIVQPSFYFSPYNQIVQQTVKAIWSR